MKKRRLPRITGESGVVMYYDYVCAYKPALLEYPSGKGSWQMKITTAQVVDFNHALKIQ
jgi:hypothetical protein